MELLLETVALYSLKLAYETEGHSPILRDDPLMGDYDREVFGLLVRRGDLIGDWSVFGFGVGGGWWGGYGVGAGTASFGCGFQHCADHSADRDSTHCA